MKHTVILFWILTSLILVLQACQQKSDNSEKSQAQQIVDMAIQEGGMSVLEHASASFNFRNRTYTYDRAGSEYTYRRIFKDTVGQTITDILTNEGLQRLIDDSPAELTEKRRNAYANSVNSVIYFAFLPYFLNDAAVIKNYAGQEIIKGVEYYKIKVNFQQEGGGKDFEDVFYYWFQVDNYSMDYLAYEYFDDERDIRFREAYNTRVISGVKIQDYHNYKPSKGIKINLADVANAFEQGAMEWLSDIELEEISIQHKPGS